MNILTPRLQTYIGGYVLHQRCVCHILNLVVQDGMQVIGPYLNSIRDAIRYLASSPQVVARFAEYCTANGKEPKKFGLDMKVRWNSTYIMLKKIQGYENIISVFVNANCQNNELLVTNSDWRVASHFREFLKPFYKATKVLSGIYYPTSCLVIEFIWLIADKIAKSRDDAILGHAVVAMEEKIVKYFGSLSHLYCFAIIFDPTKKLAGLQEAMEGIGECLGLDFSEAFEHVKQELFRVFRLYHDKFASSGRSEAPQQTQHGKTGFGHLWKKLKDKSTSSSSQSQASSKWNSISELNHYLEHDFANIDHDLTDGSKIDLLEWWKNNKRIFPVLSHFVRDVLLVPVSTVSSEATFSTVGRIIEERRSSLTPRMVEAITCAKDWELAKEREQHQLEDPEIVQAYADLDIAE